MITRETIPHDHVLEGESLSECRELLEKCRLYPNFAGGGHLITLDEEIAERLLAGWIVGVDDFERPVQIRCSRFISVGIVTPGQFTFTRDPGAPIAYDLNMPPPMVTVAREILDERRSVVS